MLKKADIVELCIKVAEDYPDWEFSSLAFKNKEFKHSVKLVDPLWSFPGCALAQPIAGFLHKKTNVVFKYVYGCSSSWTSHVSLVHDHKDYNKSDLWLYDLVDDQVEEKIRKMLNDGIEVIEQTYDFSSEENLLKNMPADLEGQNGVRYCIVKAYLGDFDFVRRYRADEIVTGWPKCYEQIDKVIEYYGIK